MEFANLVKGENILLEFVNVNMRCRINVSEYQIEGALSVFFSYAASRW